MVSPDSKVHNSAGFFFLFLFFFFFFLSLIIIRSGRLVTIRWSICISIITIIYSLWVFHISVSWGSFTGVWVTASLLKYPGLFSVFSPFALFIIIIIIYSFRVFYISVSWWYFSGYWVTASLLKSPGLFSVFWPFSIMLLFGWSPLGRQLPNFPGFLTSFSYRAKSSNHNWYNCHLHVP